MYKNGFDPHYLVDEHIKRYFPYFDIKKVIVDGLVYGPEGDIIYSWNY